MRKRGRKVEKKKADEVERKGYWGTEGGVEVDRGVRNEVERKGGLDRRVKED